MTETELMHAIMVALSVEPGVVLWRNHTGYVEVVDENGARPQRFGVGGKGGADLIGIVTRKITIPSDCGMGDDVEEVGVFVALEVKTPKGRVAPEQTMHLEIVRRAGGFAAVVRSVDDAKAALERARNGASQ